MAPCAKNNFKLKTVLANSFLILWEIVSKLAENLYILILIFYILIITMLFLIISFKFTERFESPGSGNPRGEGGLFFPGLLSASPGSWFWMTNIYFE